ncbi:Vacuolar protein sorting-associated protein 13B [Camponotus floridanus]|uniref:Vacuolar protein sorting-associated protein 13B n=1 Tax=Camponotus floridanus TaxID=104421 RepID=E2AKD0_CAMFO|nr:Vacuolar protein sorting-associated protein 13B [Camponotus floridanus]
MVSSVLPVDWDNNWSAEQQMAYSGHIIHLGVYIDDATLTFKTVESVKEQLFYKSRKIRYKSFLSLQLNGVVMDTLIQGIAMTTFQVGVACIQLYPRGTCSCGHVEVVDGVQPPLYVIAGNLNIDYLKDSLFDEEAVENKGKKRDYKQGIDYHMMIASVEKLLERCPAFVMDYAYFVELPDDITPERLLEFGSNFEYSNFQERRIIRYLSGNLTIRLCSGIFHRIDTIKQAAAKYDYNPYIVTKPDPPIDELPPVTLEEYEALRENVSMMETKLILKTASLQLQLADHCVMGVPRQRKIVETRTIPLSPALTDDPFVSIECDEAIATIIQPMYPFRLVACASKLTDLQPEMFSQCHAITNIQITGAKSQLHLTKNCDTSIVMPYSVEASSKILLYPQYWRDIDMVQKSYSFQSDSITITGTKAKLMAAVSIATSIFSSIDTNPLICSTLFNDACQEKSPVYLELYLENIMCKNVSSSVMISNEMNVNSIKIFALNDLQQAFILSGPENCDDNDTGNVPLLSSVIQFPKNVELHTHPSLVSFKIAEIRASLDPLFFEWLKYRATYHKSGSVHMLHSDSQQLITEGTSSDTGTRKKTFPSLYESVHSSSDKEKKRSAVTEKSKTLRYDETQKKAESKIEEEQQKSGILVKLAESYSWWCSLVLSGHIGHIIIYIPSNTMSGIGADGMQSFPWTLSLVDFHCFTLEQTTQKNFIKKVTLNATIALTTKTAAIQSNTLTALSICVHIDNSPILISLSEEQVVFMSNIVLNIIKILQTLCGPRENNTIVRQMSNEMQIILPAIPQTPSTPTQIMYQEDTTNSTVSTSKDDLGYEKDGLVITAWIQWTITKVAIKLYILEQEDGSSLKLMLELEDIITSLDLQSIYMQLKSKITTATILHYVRGPHALNWDVGEYAGLILCGREDNLEKGDDSGFLSFTLTRAKSGNVYTRWGTHKRYKLQKVGQKKEMLLDSALSMNGYISEIFIKMQMVDIILPLSVISKYIQLVKPFARLSSSIEKSAEITRDKSTSTSFTNIITLNNELLPLIHLEFKGFRLMMPALNHANKLQHDLLMLQLDGIRITPDAENPICRTPLRTDIYQLAAQANILNVPGSAVEDRQYQINVKGVCAYTTTWRNYQLSINKRMSQSYLYTMNENPALEWNKLGNGSSLDPYFSTSPVLTKFDLCLIIAPAVTFKGDTIVCGSAIEVNCITDIEWTINFDQIKLISTLNNEFITLMSRSFEKVENQNNFNNTIQKFSNSQNTKPASWLKQTSDDSDIDFTKDSGVDFEMSSVHSTVIGRPAIPETMILPPFEFLVNCGKITLILYEVQNTAFDLEGDIDMHKVNCEDDNDNVKQPLFYLMINQPNIYFFQQHLSKKIQISCFDITTALGNAQNLNTIPTEKDFKIFMIETKHGDLHPDTGIPPSFATIKSEMILGKNRQFFIEMGRPTKIHLSLSRLNQLYNIRNKVLSCFMNDNVTQMPAKDTADLQNLAAPIKSRKLNVPDLHLSTKQIVLSLKTDTGAEIIISLASLNGNLSTLVRPDRIYSSMSIDSFIISAILNGNIKVLLNPWCCNITTCLLWESSYSSEVIPQIQIQADSESLYLDFGPDQIKIIKIVMRDCQLLLSEFSSLSTSENKNEKQIILSTEQHYKDDLKAGAFQFVDGTADELPFPYQVVFFAYPQQAMAWRYPQPRTLTRIHISPVPFETVDADGNYIDRISCILEYWSDSHMSYQRYADFYLSETDSYRLDLPERAPARAVACVWRVVISSSNKRSLSKSIVSARVLAACLRIDSYFNPLLIPNVQIALNIGVLHVSLYNHIDTTVYNNLPPPLDIYTLNGRIPEIQCFMSIEQKGAVLVLNKWMDNSTLLDISGTLSAHVLDYSHLTMQEVLDSLEGRLQLSLSDKIDASLTSNPFTLKLGPAITHTLAVSIRLWLASFDEEEKSVIVLTRYVIANDSNIPIRFGQSGTGDSILLESRQCNFYSWRQIGNQMIRISIEENAWVWSRPFPVNKNGIHVIEFNNSVTGGTVVFVNVTSLSATQKLVTFSGQLVISNQLMDNFEMRLVKYETDVGSKVTVSKEVYPIPGKSFPSSIMLENNRKMAMRLRFTNLTHLSWTGDIPLQPNVKWGQPWLVKVPLQERGQFFSIWVRIVTQMIQDKVKILAVLSPLYMIRSHLPVPVKVQMETPSLKMSLSTMVNGRGECQQLYCPGTFEHFHQLTFQLESGVSASNPYVPLSYSSVDQRKFFRRPDIEDIDKILQDLKDRKDDAKWPFQGDDTGEEWISAEQPQTHVQVKYQDAGLVSSTLLLELQPWCFIMNSLGCHISLVSEDTELCQIPHYGIVTPPKLEDTFYVGVGIGDTYYMSQTLQLARPDWSQSFYMPRINGIVPVDGNIKTFVDCGTSVSILSIGSSMHEDMRLVRIASSHVIANLTSQELCVATLAIHEEDTRRDLQLPHDLTPCSLNVSPSEDQRQGIPIVQWYTLYTESNVEPLVLYISLSLGHRWSCPIRVDQAMSRKSVAIPNGSSTMPVIVTTQEDKGTTFIVIHADDHPQLLIENACGFKILLGQANEKGSEILPDSVHFTWMCEVDSGATSHYSLPCVSNRLPDTIVPSASNVLLFSTVQNHQVTEKASLKWSRGVNLSALSSTPMDQYLRLPSYGDVKLIMQNRCYTIHISIVPISQIEISAQDIRSRLLRKKYTAKDHDIIAPISSKRSEEDKLLQYVQSSSSSTSLTSFFSAQEDILPMESMVVSSSSKQLIPKVAEETPTDESQSKSSSNASSNPREGSITVYLRACTIAILHDINENAQRIEVASLSMTDLVVTVNSKARFINLHCYIGDLQLDNQLFDQGGFDFPVVLINQNPLPTRGMTFYSNNCLMTNMEKIKQDSLIAVEYIWEVNGSMIASKEYRMRIAPISAYIEDTYITQLLDYATSMIPPRLVLNDSPKRMQTIAILNAVYIPDYIMIDSKILSKPLRLQNFVIEPLSILLSVHTSVRLYVALDHSPLYFGIFERKNLLTTPYRLGNALTMHYLSGAIFGAGWVVGSLEILGSPGGLAQALGSGLRDFVSLPFQGLLQGPWGFIVGITHGSASLMKHVTAGTVNSVTKLASSVARNLDRLTLDEEHLQRQEESRRMRPQGMAQGLYQGLTGLGMSLLAAVAGLAHHPLQQVWSGEATTKSLVTGVGLGLVGVVTKPLSGAAELVALTGQGLLQGAGWNSLPTPRQRPIVQYTTGNNSTSVRYTWRLSPLLDHSHDSILHVTSADYVIHQGSNRAVTLVLTRQALLLVNMAEDSVERIFSLKELTSVDHITDSTMLCLYCPPATTQSSRPLSPADHEMNQEMRARVEEYVRTSSTGLASVSTNSDRQSDTFEKTSPHPEHTLTFYVCPDTRNYLLSLFNIAKRQNQGSGFAVL